MKIILNAKTLKRQHKKGRKCNFIQNFTTTSVLKLRHFDSIHLNLRRQCIFMIFSFFASFFSDQLSGMQNSKKR